MERSFKSRIRPAGSLGPDRRARTAAHRQKQRPWCAVSPVLCRGVADRHRLRVLPPCSVERNARVGPVTNDDCLHGAADVRHLRMHRQKNRPSAPPASRADRRFQRDLLGVDRADRTRRPEIVRHCAVSSRDPDSRDADPVRTVQRVCDIRLAAGNPVYGGEGVRGF